MRNNYDSRPPVRGKRDGKPAGAGRPARKSYADRNGSEAPRRRSYTGRIDGDDAPRRSYTRRSDGDQAPRRSYTRRNDGDQAPRRSYTRRNDGDQAPRRSYTRRSDGDQAPRRSYTRRSDGDQAPRRSYTRRSDGDQAPRRSYTRRSDGDQAPRRSYTRRSDGDQAPRRSYTRGGDGDQAPRRSYTRRSDTKREPIQTKPDSDIIRLNKFISNSGICSRREADTYITTGLVSVNGVIVTELGTKVNKNDDIRFNGERLKGEKKVYILMNKPKNFVTTLSDSHAEKTVMDLITNEKCRERVYPVGRLDKATTGVLLFTNDGEMAEKLTHPTFQVRKIYHAFLDKNLKKPDFDKILSGITLEDGEIHADALSYVDDDLAQVGIEIHSGRNRIVRRIFESLGYRVKKLDRVYFAGLTKKNLKRGEWRFLTDKEIDLLKMGAFE